MAKKRKKTIEELECELSSEGVRLAREAVEAIDAFSRSSQECHSHPEKLAIWELMDAYQKARWDPSTTRKER
jgi:hypothetical protein